MRTHGSGWSNPTLLLAGFLARGCYFPLMTQADTQVSSQTPKRVHIGLSGSQLETPFPAGSVQAVGGAGSVPADQSAVASSQPPERKGEWIFAPIPISSQAIGFGIAPIAAYVFYPSRSDRVSPPSTIAMAGVYTSTRTYGFGFGGMFNLKEDRYRFTVFAGAARARYEFFGIGAAAGSADEPVWLSQHGHAVFGQGLRRLKWRIFAGPRVSQRQIKAGQEISLPNPSPTTPILDQLNHTITSAGAGLRVQRDTRDDMFYPRRGSRLDGRADFYGSYAGSTFTFQTYQFEANKYLPFGERYVLALRGMGCGVSGDKIPFFELCQFGWAGDLRGYQTGRYRDRTMFATQAEWRAVIWRRFGGTAFGGAGAVAPGWGSYKTKDLLPAGGVGLRYNLSKQRRINLRADVAYSKTGGSWSMGVAEVF